MDTGVVIAFSESPSVQETLSVLLEHDCQLRFLRPDAAASMECRSASVALVATRSPTPVVQELRRHWPALPIVNVELPGTPTAPAHAPAAGGRPDAKLCTIALEPHAIRGAVLQRLVPDRDAPLRATIEVLADTLRAELAYALAALRSLTSLHATSAGLDTYALLGTVMREQGFVIDERIDHMDQFRARPRAVEISPHFPALLCRQLGRPDRLTEERGLRCECVIDAACPEAGPITLVPTVAAFLRAHLRRRTDARVVGVRVTRHGVTVRYPQRRTAAAAARSWPLLLAALALQPWSWSVSTAGDGEQEIVSLRPAA